MALIVIQNLKMDVDNKGTVKIANFLFHSEPVENKINNKEETNLQKGLVLFNLV